MVKEPKIKYVKKAHSWCVSSWNITKEKKNIQEQKWFSTEQEALEYLTKIKTT